MHNSSYAIINQALELTKLPTLFDWMDEIAINLFSLCKSRAQILQMTSRQLHVHILPDELE